MHGACAPVVIVPPAPTLIGLLHTLMLLLACMSFPEDGLDAAELQGFLLNAAHHYAESLFVLVPFI